MLSESAPQKRCRFAPRQSSGAGRWTQAPLHAEALTVLSARRAIAVVFQHSNDGRNWHSKTTLVSAQAISTTATTTFFGSDAGTTPSMALCRLKITLGGTNPSCKVRIHVCARDDS